MARNKIEVEILGDSRSLERAFGRSSSAASRWSGSITKSVSRVPLAVAAATAALGAGLVTAAVKGVQAASNLNEQVNKTRVVFAGSSKEILAWSKGTAASLGLSQRAALEAAGGFGQMLQTAGITEKQSASFSKSLVKLAADMASFNNINPDEALLKLKSGLAGEAEPLRTVGVLLSEARVKAEAYASGIAKQGAQLTEGQKVQARYNLILKDTAKQQGDFGRTSKSLANATRIIKALAENAAASLGNFFLPSVAKAASGVADFIAKLQKTKGVRAKFRVAVEGLEDLGDRIFRLARNAIAEVNWPEAVKVAQDGLVAGLRKIGEALDSIDWGAVGRELGQALATGLKGAKQFLQSVDWQDVGQTIVRGIANFLKSVDWKSIAVATIKLLVAAMKASASLALGIGKEIGGQIMAGIGQGLDKAKDHVLQKLLLFVKKVLGVTGFLGRFDPFKGVRAKVQKQLAGMESDVKVTVGNIQTEMEKIRSFAITFSTNISTAASGDPRDEGAVAGDVAASAKKAADKARAASKAQAEIAAKAARDVKAFATKRDEAFQSLMDSLSLKLDRAQVTAGIGDDLKVLAEQERAVRAQIAAAGRSVDLERQLFQIEQERASIREQQRNAQREAAEKAAERTQQRQFRALGLSADGQERIPGVDNLRKQFASLTDRVAESPGQVSNKLTSRLAGVRKLLSGAFGKLSEDTREAIRDLFGAIRDEFENQDRKGPLTKTTSINSKAILSGLGLSGDQVRELRGRLSGFNSAGLALAGNRSNAGAFVGGPVELESTTILNVDGHQITKVVTRGQQKRTRRNPAQRRGPNMSGV